LVLRFTLTKTDWMKRKVVRCNVEHEPMSMPLHGKNTRKSPKPGHFDEHLHIELILTSDSEVIRGEKKQRAVNSLVTALCRSFGGGKLVL
jgi:hypothetical protein